MRENYDWQTRAHTLDFHDIVIKITSEISGQVVTPDYLNRTQGRKLNNVQEIKNVLYIMKKLIKLYKKIKTY